MKFVAVLIASFLLLASMAGFGAQPAEKPEKPAKPAKAKVKYDVRYGLQFNPTVSPQATPKETLASIVKLLSDERIEYLMAHIADPAYVDAKIEVYMQDFAKGDEQGKALLSFQRLVRETTKHYLEDAELIQELRRFAREAEWEVNEDQAVGTVKELLGRQVILRRLEGRWFLKNRQDRGPEPTPEK